MLKIRGWGGGHHDSAGMFCFDLYDFQNKMIELENELSQKYPKQEKTAV